MLIPEHQETKPHLKTCLWVSLNVKLEVTGRGKGLRLMSWSVFLQRNSEQNPSSCLIRYGSNPRLWFWTFHLIHMVLGWLLESISYIEFQHSRNHKFISIDLKCQFRNAGFKKRGAGFTGCWEGADTENDLCHTFSFALAHASFQLHSAYCIIQMSSTFPSHMLLEVGQHFPWSKSEAVFSF